MTIHDCIHLRFPQYLPNRAALYYARTMMTMAARRARRVLTVSQASKDDILHYLGVPADKVEVIYNALDERLATPPTAEEVDARPRALPADVAVHPLRGQHQAAQERRPADRGVLDPAAARRRGRQAADHRRRDLEVPEPAPARASLSAAPARPVPRLRPGRDARRALSAGVGVRVSVALRRVRPAAARGDGRRHAGHHVERVVAARKSSATPRCSSIRWTPARSPTRWRACSATRRCAPTWSAAAASASRRSRGSDRSRACARSTPSSPGRPRMPERRRRLPRPGRPPRRARARLAHRHARRREGARVALPALSGRRSADARSRPGLGVAAHRGAPDPDVVRAAAAAARRAATGTTCRSSRRPSSCSTSTTWTWSISTSHCAAKSVVPTGRARARLLLPLADALRVGSVRRLFRRRAARARSATRSRGRSWPGWPAGIAPRRTGSIASWPTRATLPGGSRGTIIVGRRSCIRRWTPSSSRRTARRPRPTFSWYPPSCPTSASTWPSTPPRGSACR